MGNCTCYANVATASTTVSAGPDTVHACFMVCLKIDLYQPKYANIPMTYTASPCPHGKGYVDETYGEGTVFNGFNIRGAPERVVVSEIVPLEKIVLTNGIHTMTYILTALPNNKCLLEFKIMGRNIGIFQRHVTLQTNKMKCFIETNAGPICEDAPPVGSKTSTTSTSSLLLAPAFCVSCGTGNSGNVFCTSCGNLTGGAATGAVADKSYY